ncbi:MAG TPA: bifunctional diaminohydroxyphosphoribosylaminopyrimidine deaminase/5-amino-6-(5-phosphoribosylamino)uracil reductase RibD [Thermodesulfovibrionales bacterium]|nr:bifunctional diaminohydroxyphosphoribosylaminopyrimidine deaminase/5-amino-6-(5-phosphoribosylamino)uracil reductase RibD [Thermodesulfovibrionales bacterium]
MADRLTEEHFMERAIMLAARARGMTSPNPMVGAVIVKDEKIIAEDYHRKAGTPHAEALALSKAGRDARASTLYVSLEPCCHTDKRTPPCTKAIIGAGVKRVIVAMRDPNTKVSGRGIRELEEAGIKVISGIAEAKARRLNESYIKYITTGKPFVTLKVAMTLDGKIATPEGQSKWITGQRARLVVHKLRSGVDAVMTAIGTVKTDDPQLTVRLKGKRKNPVRVVIDPNIEIPLDAKILKVPPETIIVAKEPDAARKSVLAHKLENLALSGTSLLYFREKLALHWLMERLGERGITSVMIEGGSSLNAHALEDGIVDKVIFFIAPKIIGSRESFPAVGGKDFRRLEDAFSLKDMRVRRLGDDIMIEGYL